jgi:hypothetical protein
MGSSRFTMSPSRAINRDAKSFRALRPKLGIAKKGIHLGLPHPNSI